MKKRQLFDIYHIDSTGEEHFLARHCTTSLHESNGTLTLQGASLFKLTEYFYIPTSNLGVFREQNFYTWMTQIADGRTIGVVVEYPGTLGSKIVKGQFDSRVSLRNAYTALALSCNLYIDSNASTKISMLKTDDLFAQTEYSFDIPEEEVFAGDTIEYNTAYKYLTLTIKTENGGFWSSSITNESEIETETTKDISPPLYSSLSQSTGLNDMLNSESQYYFNNMVYKANTLCKAPENCYNIVGKKGTINGHVCILTRRKLTLDGPKLYAENQFIYLSEAE